MLLLILFCINFIFIHASTSFPESNDEVTEFKEFLKEDNLLAVLFTEECCACTDCVEAEALLGAMSQELEENLEIQVVRLRKPDLRARYLVKSVPALVYIRDKTPALYDGKFDADMVYTWLQDNKEPATIDLVDETFEHLTQASSGATTGDWLVFFYSNSCFKNRDVLHLENAAVQLKGKMNVAKVNTEKAPETLQRFKVTACPETIFFRHQKMYRFSLPEITAATLKRFALGFYKNSKAENVPFPVSLMDRVRDTTKKIYQDYWGALVLSASLITALFTSMFICALIKPSPRRKAE